VGSVLGVRLRPELVASGVHIAKWVVASEVAAGRVIERDGRYSLAKGWDRNQLAVLRKLREVAFV
jgi:hypothetical protein